ncbi:MAG TPA: type II secretion system minor pseudopilin GspK [Geobacteraceae bacterium]
MRGGQAGFALVITLVITALLVALAVEFFSDVYVATTARQNYLDSQQASLLAESGMLGAMKLLDFKLKASGSGYTTLQDDWAKPLEIADERGSLRVTTEEENAKLSLNHVAGDNGTFNDAYYGIALRLFKSLGLPANDLCDALADWRDTNETPHPGGAESAWYLAQKQPYRAKNGRLDTVEELALVKGFAGKPLEGLKQFVTVHVAPAAPAALININTAPKEVLMALHEGITGTLADQIIDQRQRTPFTSVGELAKVPGMATVFSAKDFPGTTLTVKGGIYRLTAEATVNEVKRTIEAVVQPGVQPTYWREY